MTPDYKALREAAEKAEYAVGYDAIKSAHDDFLDIVESSTILSLLDALAASEAKLEKARDALRAFADDLVRRPWIASHLTWDVDKSSLTNRDIHRAATTLKDIT